MRRVGPFADHDHTVLVDDDHFAAVGFLEDRGVEDLIGRSFGNQPMIETHAQGKWAATQLKSWAVRTMATPW